jgi:hypothetical protein
MCCDALGFYVHIEVEETKNGYAAIELQHIPSVAPPPEATDAMRSVCGEKRGRTGVGVGYGTSQGRCALWPSGCCSPISGSTVARITVTQIHCVSPGLSDFDPKIHW